MHASETENVLLGVRKPNRSDIEFSLLPVQSGSNLLPVLKRDYSIRPELVFPDAAADRRIVHVDGSIPFHDIARQVNASRWFLHQTDAWHDGIVHPQHRQSLLERLYHASNSWGGGRFHPNRGSLNSIDSSGFRRNCLMGMATELFMDDYPSALYRIEQDIPGLGVHMAYGVHHGWGLAGAKLPDIVQRTLGFRTPYGSFQLDARSARILEHSYRAPVAAIASHVRDWNLVDLNDHAMNWPAAAELIAAPASGLLER